MCVLIGVSQNKIARRLLNRSLSAAVELWRENSREKKAMMGKCRKALTRWKMRVMPKMRIEM
jgi:hypothetical protein